jgi:hypothetical protein
VASFNEFTLDEMEEGPVEKADLLVSFLAFTETGPATGEGRYSAVVRDDATGEFARPVGQPSDARIRAEALSPDGRSILFLADPDRDLDSRLCLHRLATGEQRWYAASPSTQVHAAAISPNGETIAALTGAESGMVAVDFIEVADGSVSRQWSTAGSWSAETTISWSPSGQLIAATYTIDDDWMTSVVDIKAGALRHYDYAILLSASNGPWLRERQVAYIQGDDMRLVVRDVDRDDRRELVEAGGDLRAIVGDRLLWTGPRRSRTEPASLVTTNLEGDDLRAIASLHSHGEIMSIDVARGPGQL